MTDPSATSQHSRIEIIFIETTTINSAVKIDQLLQHIQSLEV